MRAARPVAGLKLTQHPFSDVVSVPNMTKNMAALIVLLALLLAFPAFGAESLDNVPQVVETVADKQEIEPSFQSLRQTPVPSKNDGEAAAKVDSQQRLDELQRELLDTRREFLDVRTKNVDSWLAATAIVLTFFGIIAVIAGYLSFKRFGEIEAEARGHMETSREHAEKAKKLVDNIATAHDKVQRQAAEVQDKAELVSNAPSPTPTPSEAGRLAANVQANAAGDRIDRAIATALQLQKQEKFEEAAEKYRAIANVAGEDDHQLKVWAWFSYGYLLGEEENPDLETVIYAYTKVIELDRNYGAAYTNRGVARGRFGQYEAALADLSRALELDPDNVFAHSNIAYVKICLGQLEGALANSSRALELDPDNAFACNQVGFANESLGRTQKARENYQRALTLAQKAGQRNLVAKVQKNLDRLDGSAGS